MPWVRLDDAMPEHPKIIGLSDAAFRLHVTALCWCARSLSDGDVPTAALRRLGDGADELVRAGVWLGTETGYRIHDYLDFNPSRESVEVARADSRERMQVNRAKTGVGIAKTSESASTIIQRGPANDVERVFTTWAEAAEKPRSILDDRRRRKIQRAIASHGVDDVLLAVVGWKRSAWHRGENDRGTVYNDIDLLLRNSEKIEQFRDMAATASVVVPLRGADARVTRIMQGGAS